MAARFAAAYDASVAVWALGGAGSEERSRRLTRITGLPSPARALLWLPESDRLALGCDDGVVEPLVEASMPPVVADAPAGNDVEAVKDEWSRIPGRVMVKYNVEEGADLCIIKLSRRVYEGSRLTV